MLYYVEIENKCAKRFKKTRLKNEGEEKIQITMNEEVVVNKLVKTSNKKTDDGYNNNLTYVQVVIN